MSTPLTLEAVKADFDHWRQHKTAPQCRVPQPLKDKALALREHFSTQHIVKALQINLKRFMSWGNTSPSHIPETPPDFVQLPVKQENGISNQAQSPATPHSIQITCQHPNGAQWCLQGDFSAQQLSAVVNAMNEPQGGLG